MNEFLLLTLIVIGFWVISNIGIFFMFNIWIHEEHKKRYKKHWKKIHISNTVVWIVMYVVFFVIILMWRLK
jgi:hypothetical protein